MRALLKQLLDLVPVAPDLRREVEAALACEDPRGWARSGRVLVDTLLRDGSLVRVSVSGHDSGPPLYAARGHATLLELGELVPGSVAGSAPGDETTATPAPADPEAGGQDLVAHERLFQAMERAQAMQAAGGAGSGLAASLADVIEMIEPYLPGLTFYIELFPPYDAGSEHDRVFHAVDAGRPFWSAGRVEGQTVWIPGWSELPVPLRRRAASGVKDVGDPLTQGVAVAVPLYPPGPEDALDDDAAGEAGLLYVLSERHAERKQLVRLGRRLSRFVTHGWQQRRRMNRLVHTDPLTGIRNRAFFDQQFPLELERARRHGTSLALVLVDIDHFKDVNDTYGHPAGDRILRAVARELLDGLRRIDLVCRVGGEEFALVLPDTALDAVNEVVPRLQVGIANHPLADPDAPEPLRVTVSCGGVVFPDAGDTAGELYRKADEMLYLSKQRGRNRCHVWNPDGDPILTLPRYQAR